MDEEQITKLRSTVVGFDGFILAIRQWFIDGMPKGENIAFLKPSGLCANHFRFTTLELGTPKLQVCKNSLSNGFYNTLYTLYPFNSGCSAFMEEIRTSKTYENLDRLKFVGKAWKIINT